MNANRTKELVMLVVSGVMAVLVIVTLCGVKSRRSGWGERAAYTNVRVTSEQVWHTLK